MPEKLEDNTVEANPEFEAVVARVSATVLETMFFEEAVEIECEHAWLETAISVRLNFNGSHSGEFLLNVSPQAARCIAAGFLGLDADELAEGQAGQVMLELTNILCGAAMSNLWPESSLSLDPPELVSSSEIPPEFMHCCFQLPDGKVSVSLRVLRGVESVQAEETWGKLEPRNVRSRC